MRAGGERVPLSSWREEGDDWHWPVSWAGLLGQARPQVSSLFLFLFLSNFLTFVWFNKSTKPFYLLMPIFVGASGYSRTPQQMA